ncbi:MAG: leucine-rich repeat protein, partial [Eggerthellaceae bacterium]|nr:leucine-rich repeat protein [Eggerthellaceae bacterium]
AAGAKAQFPAFRQSRTVGGVTVTVEADVGAFPEGAVLSVASAPSSMTEAAVAAERDGGANVAASYTFDIKVLGADGAELQPAGGRPVRVSFKAAEVADPNLDVSVYHVSGGEAEELAVSESGSTATARTDGFSYYTVEFTYGDLQYVLPGGESVPLADILAVVGLQGEPTDVQVSDSDLFSVSRESGELVVSSHQAFSSKEWMRVTIAGRPYKIAVTDDDQEGDYIYVLNNPGTAHAFVRITGYSGNGGAITIPSELDGVSVREIGTQAFENKKGITSVTIPEGVVKICGSAFEGCTSLNSVTIPASVTSIDPHAFSDCTNLGSVTIPAGVKIIGHDAFSGCTQLESVTIPAGVTSIGNGAFLGCSGLTSVTIMSGNTTFGQGVFGNCSNLKDVYYAGTQDQWNDVKSAFPGGLTVHYPCAVVVSANPTAAGEVGVSTDKSAPACPGGKYWSGTRITLEAELNLVDYVFVNWTEGGPSAEGEGQSAGGATQVSTDNPYTFEVTSDRELTANFAEECTVTFMNTDGLPLQIVRVAKGLVPAYTGATPTMPPEGGYVYTFAGWEPEVGPAAGDATYMARYYMLKSDCTITWRNYDGKLLKSDRLAYGVTPKYDGTTPTRPDTEQFHYEFAGWEPEPTSVTGDAKYTAKYAAKPRGNHAYKASSGEGSAYVEGTGTPLAFTFERTVDPETAFAHFVGGILIDGKAVPQKGASGRTNWTARSGSVIVELQPSFLETLPAGAHTIAALFDDGDPASAGFTVSAPATHTMTFDANGHGEAPDAQEVEHGKKAKRPANPTADGYTFGGWYTDKACKEAYDFSSPVTEDVTLYAKWTKKSSSASGTSPKTGDPAGGVFAIALALAAASALALAFSRRRSRG